MKTVMQYSDADKQQWAMKTCKKLKNSTSYPFIPDEIIFDSIASRLPVKSILRFSCVSKLWYTTFRDPKFIESHLIHAKESSSSKIGVFQVYMGSKEHGCDYIFVRKEGPYFCFDTQNWTCRVGDCNGLFCNRSGIGFEICNPCTREFLYIPLPRTPSGCLISYGFGFDPSASEYKVVQLVLGKEKFRRCMVYTLGRNSCSWRNVTVASKLSDCLNDDALRGVNSLGGIVDADSALYSKNSLHWFFRRAFRIMSFDIHHERFTLIRGPDPGSFFKGCRCFLIERQNSFCLAFHKLHSCKVHLYKLNKLKRTWDRTVVLLPCKPTSTIGFLSGASLLYWSNEGARLWLYSPEKHELDYIDCSGAVVRQIYTLPPSLGSSSVRECKLVNHIENLVSLKTLVPMQASSGVRFRSVSSL